jgi:hypothetical protein
MKWAVNNRFPRPRTLIHPGHFNPVRIHSLRSSAAKHVRLALLPGMSLYEGLVKSLADVGILNASTTILGGYFEKLDYCVAPPDPSGQAVIAYTQPIDAGRSYMVFGNATLGKSMSGSPLVHCHATIVTESGVVKGGHIMPESCIVGHTPIPVLVTSLDDFELRQTYDPETNMPLLQPYKELANE